MKTKSIILTQPELRSAIDGRLTRIVRVMKRQPPSEACRLGKLLGDDLRLQNKWLWYDKSDVLTPGVYFDCPFPPGESAFVKEPFGVHEYAESSWPDVGPGMICYRVDGDSQPVKRWMSANTLPQKFSRLTIKFTAVEAKQAKDLTLEEMRECGFDVNDYMVSYNQELERIAVDGSGCTKQIEEMAVSDFCGEHNIAPDTWLWVWKVEVER